MQISMNAAVLYAPGDLRVEQTVIDTGLLAEEALIKVRAAGICGSDLDRIMKTGTYHFPTIPGHEFAGEIAAINSTRTDLQTGDRVVAAPIMPCFHCESCQQGNYGQCDDYNYLGSRTNGGFAEYVKVPVKNLLPLPSDVPFSDGAMVEPASVTLHGMMRLNIRPGDTVAVLGCGAIGLFAVQFARILGAAEIIAVDIDSSKLEMAALAGAGVLINGRERDTVEAVLEATGRRGADIAIETAGTSITQVQSIAVTKKHGQLLFLGTAHHDVVIPPKVFEHIVRNEIHITGSWNSFSAPFPGREWSAVINYLHRGSLEMASFVTHTIRLAELPEMIRKMSSRELSFNKVIVEL